MNALVSRRTAGVVASAWTALTVLGACSAFSSGDDPPASSSDGGGPVEASMEASTDAMPSADAPSDSTTGDAGRTNLLLNGDFELGCADWAATYADLSVEATGRSGKGCRVCSNAAVGYTIFTQVTETTLPGAKYVGEAYLRKAPGTFAAASMRASVGVADPVMYIQPGVESSGPAIDDQWRSISALTVVAVEGGTRLILTISSGSTGTCFLIDDAVLYRAE